MAWFYVDDGFSDSKPVLNMPDRHRLAACGLWVLAGSWSAKEELDGFVPNSKLRQLGATPAVLAALTENGPMFAPLCAQTPSGIQLNSWSKWQKTREELAEKRREDAERQRAWRAAHPDAKPAAKTRGRNTPTSPNTDSSQCDTHVTDNVTNAVTDPISDDMSQCDLARTGARPDPTRPDPIDTTTANAVVAAQPTKSAQPRTKPRTRIPDGYLPEPPVRTKIREEFPAVGDDILRSVHEDFCLYWKGQGKPMADWDATWLRWMRKELPKHTIGRSNGASVSAFERKKAHNAAVFASLGDNPQLGIEQ